MTNIERVTYFSRDTVYMPHLTSSIALFMLELRLSESPPWYRQLVTGGSSELASVNAADLSLGLHTRMLSPAHH